MLKSLALRSLQFIILFLLGSAPLKAQLNHFVLTPENKASVVSGLLYSFNYFIYVPEDDIKTFIYRSQEGTTYNEEIEAPAVYQTSATPSSVSFAWNNLPPESTVRIQYINMDDGHTGEVNLINQSSVTLPNETHNRYIYLFSYFIKNRRGVAKSGDHIIIEENPAIRGVNLSTCDCEFPLIVRPPTLFEDISANNSILLDASSLDVGTRYKVSFETDEGIDGSFNVVSRGGKEPYRYEVSINGECIENVKIPLNEFQFYGMKSMADDRGFLGFSVGEEAGLRMVWLDESVRGTIKITDCGSAGEGRGGERSGAVEPLKLEKTTLENFPNPSTGYSTLKYQLAESGPVTLVLTNANGQVLQTLHRSNWQEAGDYWLDLDLEGQPNGLYQCHLQTEAESTSVRLLKIE